MSDDTISRQAAIDAVTEHSKWLWETWRETISLAGIIEVISNLPSAQPEPCEEVQHILDYLDNVLHPLVSPEHWNVYSELYDMIAALPSAQPQLDEWCDTCKEYDQERHCCPRFNRVIRTTLDDVRKDALEQRWIPCSERLPENGLYIITGKKGSVYPLKIEDGRWYGGIKPVAWMPLPEPYEEQST